MRKCPRDVVTGTLILLLTVLFSLPHHAAAAGLGVLPGAEASLPSGAFLPAELILKVSAAYKDSLKPSDRRFGIASLDRLCEKFGVSGVSPAFPLFDPAGTAKRFPERARRAPGVEKPTDLSTIFRVELEDGAATLQAIRAFAAEEAVAYAQPDTLLHLHATTPDDPFFASSGSWGQGFDDQWNLKRVSLPQAWDHATGVGTVIAVVDTGLDVAHEDLQGNLWTNPGEVGGGKETNGVDDDGNGYVDDVHGANVWTGDGNLLDWYGHGTHVAGIASAVTDNGKGVAGAGWNAKIMGVNFLQPDDAWYREYYVAPEIYIAQGILYAVNNGADVINISAGTYYRSQCLREAVGHAREMGCVVVASAGNDGDDYEQAFGPVTYPCGYSAVICTGASDPLDAACNWSSHHLGVNVTAPGGSSQDHPLDHDALTILSLRSQDAFLPGWAVDELVLDDHYVRKAGTSMSAPLVAGIAALVVGNLPALTTEQVMGAVVNTADDLGTVGWDPFHGNGRVDALAAVTCSNPTVAVITSPEIGEYAEGTVPVMGSAYGPGFEHYWVDLGYGENPDSFSFSNIVWDGGGSSPVVNGQLVKVQFDESLVPGPYTIRLRVKTGAGTQRFHTLVHWYHDPQSPGFPRAMGWGIQHATPCIVDADGDGDLDLAVAANSQWVQPIAFLAMDVPIHQSIVLMEADGTPLPGWPQAIPDYKSSKDAFRCQVIVEDLDGDGAKEVVAASTGYLRVYDVQGNLLWWRTWNGEIVPGIPGMYNLYGAMALGDVTGDGRKEIALRIDVAGQILGGDDDGTFTEYDWKQNWPPAATIQGAEIDWGGGHEVEASRVIVYDADGHILEGWPGLLPWEGHYHQATELIRQFPGMVCADIDQDGKDEVITASFCRRVFVFDEHGDWEEGWPVDLGGSLENETPAVGDLDGDGVPEIVASARHADKNELFILRPDGTVWNNKPVGNFGRYPVLADLDGDGKIEIVTNGYWDDGGEPASGLQITRVHYGNLTTTERVPAPQARSKLSVGDLDTDNKPEIAYGGRFHVYAVNPEDGSAVPGFPAGTYEGTDWFLAGFKPYLQVRTPLIADLDQDAQVEVVALSDNGHLNVWDAPSGFCLQGRRYWAYEGGAPHCPFRYQPDPVGPEDPPSWDLAAAAVSATVSQDPAGFSRPGNGLGMLLLPLCAFAWLRGRPALTSGGRAANNVAVAPGRARSPVRCRGS